MTRPRPEPSTLAAAPAGARVRVVHVDAKHAPELAREGVFPGCSIEVVTRTPLGGPVIVTLGHARLAVAAAVAATIATEPLG